MNTDIIRGKIAEKRKSQSIIAKEIGISAQSLCRKLNGKRQFTVIEATKLCEALDISIEERAKIFLV